MQIKNDEMIEQMSKFLRESEAGQGKVRSRSKMFAHMQAIGDFLAKMHYGLSVDCIEDRDTSAIVTRNTHQDKYDTKERKDFAHEIGKLCGVVVVFDSETAGKATYYGLKEDIALYATIFEHYDKAIMFVARAEFVYHQTTAEYRKDRRAESKKYAEIVNRCVAETTRASINRFKYSYKTAQVTYSTLRDELLEGTEGYIQRETALGHFEKLYTTVRDAMESYLSDVRDRAGLAGR